MELYTIGFTQTTAENFFGRLKDAGVERLVDVRLKNDSQLAGFAKERDLPFFLRDVGAELFVDDGFEEEKLKLKLPHPDCPVYLPVTDLRFFLADGSIRHEAVSSVRDRMGRVPYYLMVGLGRAFPPDKPVHWLQVNGICMSDAPTGDKP